MDPVPGRDVEGTIDGKIAVGEGERLHGAESTDVEGLEVQFDSVRLVKQRFPKFIADGPEIIPNPDGTYREQPAPATHSATPIETSGSAAR